MTEQPKLPEDERTPVASPLHAVPTTGSLQGLDQAVERLVSYSESLAEDRERYRTWFLRSPVSAVITDNEGIIHEANIAAAGLLGCPRADLQGTPLSSFLGRRKLPPIRSHLASAADGGGPQGVELVFEVPGDTRSVVAATVTRGLHQDAAYLHWVLQDVTARKHAEERLVFRAAHDELTGLPSRTMFGEMLDLSIARADRREQRVAVIALDLDRFKLVNDSLGHAAGDAILIAFAGRLRSASRAADVVARRGGDEFAILLADLPKQSPGDGQPDPQEVMTRIRRSLGEPFPLPGVDVHMMASMGIATYPTDAAAPRELVDAADRAMYRAKGERPHRAPLLAASSWSPFRRGEAPRKPSRPGPTRHASPPADD